MLMNLDSVNFLFQVQEKAMHSRERRGMTPRSGVGFGIVTAVGKKDQS